MRANDVNRDAAPDLDDPPPSGSRFWSEFRELWPLLCCAAAVAAFSGNVAVSTLLPSLYAGVHTLRTGHWLFRTDPVRVRARILLLFYIAAAGWNVCLNSFLTVMASIIVMEALGRDAPSDAEILTLVMTIFAATLLMIVVGAFAVRAALKYRLRVWVHPNIRRLISHRRLPLDRLTPRDHGFNQAFPVVVIVVIAPTLMLASVGLVAALTMPQLEGIQPIAGIVAVGVFFLAPLMAVPLLTQCRARIVAGSPRECWLMVSVRLVEAEMKRQGPDLEADMPPFLADETA